MGTNAGTPTSRPVTSTNTREAFLRSKKMASVPPAKVIISTLSISEVSRLVPLNVRNVMSSASVMLIT